MKRKILGPIPFLGFKVEGEDQSYVAKGVQNSPTTPYLSNLVTDYDLTRLQNDLKIM